MQRNFKPTHSIVIGFLFPCKFGLFYIFHPYLNKMSTNWKTVPKQAPCFSFLLMLNLPKVVILPCILAPSLQTGGHQSQCQTSTGVHDHNMKFKYLTNHSSQPKSICQYDMTIWSWKQTSPKWGISLHPLWYTLLQFHPRQAFLIMHMLASQRNSI